MCAIVTLSLKATYLLTYLLTSDEERVLREFERWWGGADMEVWLCSENFVCKWKELVFNAFSYLEPVKRAKDQSDVE